MFYGGKIIDRCDGIVTRVDIETRGFSISCGILHLWLCFCLLAAATTAANYFNCTQVYWSQSERERRVCTRLVTDQQDNLIEINVETRAQQGTTLQSLSLSLSLSFSVYLYICVFTVHSPVDGCLGYRHVGFIRCWLLAGRYRQSSMWELVIVDYHL